MGNLKIRNNAIGGAKVADGTLTDADIANNSLTGADVANSSLSGADLGPGTIGGSRLAPASVTASHLADDAVTTQGVADGSLNLADTASKVQTVHFTDADVGEIFACERISAKIATGPGNVVMPVLLNNFDTQANHGYYFLPATADEGGLARVRVCSTYSDDADPPAFDLLLIIYRR